MRIEDKNGDLVIVDFDEVESFVIACKVERDGIGFYTKLLEKAKEKDTKDALAFLIKEEKDHLGFFEDTLFKLKEDKEDLNDNDILASIDYGIFQPYKSIEELENILDNPTKALKLGLAIENKSIKFYQSLRDKVSSQEAKEGLSRIIEEEAKHKQLLEGLLK